jgi:uncharacterized damage-inducible protein DinB
MLVKTLLVRLVLTASVSVAADAPTAAANPQANPISGFEKFAYAHMKEWVIKAAEKMPEESYGFRPTPAVRSYGQIVGHVADAQYMFCSAALGEKPPSASVEQTKTAKADLVGALRSAIAYCDKAYDGMTDAAAAEPVTLMKMPVPRLGALSANTMHLSEHYGNLVTYLRMKDIVPPSTEARQPPEAKK